MFREVGRRWKARLASRVEREEDFLRHRLAAGDHLLRRESLSGVIANYTRRGHELQLQGGSGGRAQLGGWVDAPRHDGRYRSRLRQATERLHQAGDHRSVC